MNAILYYFTGTGNSLSIAKTIASTLTNTMLTPINQMEYSDPIQPNADIVGIIYPTYFLDIPEPVKNFMKHLHITNGTYFFLYANYGATLGNALYNAYELCNRTGNMVGATFEVALPDNSIIFPTAPMEQSIMLKEGFTKTKKHANLILSKTVTPPPKHSYKYQLLGSIMNHTGLLYLGMNRIQILPDKCTNCNLCVSVCSSQNIKKGTTIPQVDNRCSMCYSCIHYCPNEAIRFKRMKPKTKFQYRHPDITIHEIIDSRLHLSN